MSALLKKYANITVEDLTGTEDRLYLEEYDSFYNFTSDFGPGVFESIGGEKTGDMVRLWSKEDEDGMKKVLTIRMVDGEYFIQSFQRECTSFEESIGKCQGILWSVGVAVMKHSLHSHEAKRANPASADAIMYEVCFMAEGRFMRRQARFIKKCSLQSNEHFLWGG